MQLNCYCRHVSSNDGIVQKWIRVINLTAVFMLAGALSLSAAGVSQNISFSGKNVSLQKILQVVKKQTGFVAMTSEELLSSAKLVTIDAKDIPLKDFLMDVLKDQDISFSLEEKNIILVRKMSSNGLKDDLNKLSFFAPVTTPIKGYVTDGDGNALVDATVTIKNSNTSTKTTVDGSFVINANAGDILVITFIGYDAKEIKLSASLIKNGNVGTAELIITPTAMREVQVNKGYYITKEKLNTGNVFTIKGEEIRQQPVSDPMLALEGKVPGLMISQTAGVPGAPMRIQLRGRNFINSSSATSNDPLYIVDGMPFSSQSFLAYSIASVFNQAGNSVVGVPSGLSPFNLISPADIESIEVLSDADGTAIYGSRGANGVIIINTRKGKAGKTQVDINFSQGYSKQTTPVKFLNTKQYLQMRREALQNDGLFFPSIAINPSDYNYDVNGVWDTTRYTDWDKVLLGNAAVFSNAQASISGGNANTQFLINGGYTKQGTYFPGNYSDQKGSLHFAISHSSIDQRFHIDLSGSYVTNNNNLPSGSLISTIFTTPPDAPALYDANGKLNWQPYQGTATFSNPYAYKYIYSKTLSNNLGSNLSLSYRIAKGLTLKTSFSYQTVQSAQQVVTPSTAIAPPGNTNPNQRGLNYSTTNSQAFNNETQLNYYLKIGKNEWNALLGTTIQDNKGNSLSYSATGFSSDALITNAGSASTVSVGFPNSPEYRFNSLYARIGYNWDQKYVVNLTGRRDGSSRFGPGRQFGDFGAIGLGWIFSKEKFIPQLLPWLSFGKMRASYGVTGSDGIGDYKFLSTYSRRNGGTYFGVTSLFPDGLTDPYFRWQRNNKLEGAIDLGFLGDRINTTIVYYRNRSDNQLVSYLLANSTGFGSITTNFPALVQNSGWELTLNTVNIRSPHFSWNTSINLSLPQNKLVAFAGIENGPYSLLYSVGKSMFSKLVYHYTGVDPQTGVYSFASNNHVSPFSAYPQDLFFSRPVTQQYFGGINNSIAYKGVSVNFFIQFVKQLGYNYQKVFVNPPGYAFSPQPTVAMNHWQRPGDMAVNPLFTTGQVAYLPTAAYQYRFPDSDGAITDASFIRLRSFSVSYQLPRNWQQQAHLRNARIYLQCENLFTLTHYQVLDPETQGLLAPTRTITGGIQLTF